MLLDNSLHLSFMKKYYLIRSHISLTCTILFCYSDLERDLSLSEDSEDDVAPKVVPPRPIRDGRSPGVSVE